MAKLIFLLKGMSKKYKRICVRWRKFLYILAVLVILIIFLLLVGLLNFLRITGFASHSFGNENHLVPEVGSKEEIVYYGYKYSNNSGILLSSPASLSCSWKEGKNDGGWKVCEATFEIIDLSGGERFLNNPKINLYFDEPEDVRHFKLSYSRSYELYNDESRRRFINENKTFSFERLSIERKKFKNFHDFGEIEINFTHAELNRTENSSLEESPPDINATAEEFQNNESYKEVADMNNSGIEATSHESNFTEPFESPVGESCAEEQNLTVENPAEEYNRTTEEIEVTGVPEMTSGEDNLNTGLTGFFINLFSFDYLLEKGIGLSQPTAIKVSFEIPKYSSNSFNFSISDSGTGVFAQLDPEISNCPSEFTEDNAVYLLEEDLYSDGDCVIISANNVSLDCQGHSINYSSLSGYYFGISSFGNNTNIGSCKIYENPESLNGVGVYLLGSESSSVSNSQIFGISDYGLGIYSSSSSNLELINNSISTSGLEGYGVYLDSCFNETIEINNISCSGEGAHGIYAGDSYNNSISGNIIETNGVNSYGVYLDYCSSQNLVEENILLGEGQSGGLLIYSDSEGNNISGNLANLSCQNFYGFHTQSIGNNFESNEIYCRGENAQVFYLDSNANWNNISRSVIHSYGVNSKSVSLYYEALNNTFLNSQISSSGDNSYSLYAEGSPVSFLFEDSSLESSGKEIALISGGDYYISGKFYNSSFGEIDWDGLAKVSLDFGWHTDVYSNYTNGYPSMDVRINAYDSFGEEVSSGSSDAEGLTRLNLVEFHQEMLFNQQTEESETFLTYYSNYSLNASINSQLDSVSINASNNSRAYFSFYPEPIVLFSPENGSIKNSGSNFSLEYSIYAEVIGCNLLLNDSEYFSIEAGIEKNISFSLNEGIYSWKIRCTNESEGSLESEERALFVVTPVVEQLVVSSGSGGGGGSEEKKECSAVWNCSSWSVCLGEAQMRECFNLNPSCNSEAPEMSRACKIKKVSAQDKRKNILFDISLKLLSKKIRQDQKATAKINLINLGLPGQVDANVKYTLKNASGKLFYRENEVVPVETQIEFLKTVSLTGLAEGEYIWASELFYEGQTEPAISEDRFRISNKNSLGAAVILSINLILVFAMFFALFFLLRFVRMQMMLRKQLQGEQRFFRLR